MSHSPTVPAAGDEQFERRQAFLVAHDQQVRDAKPIAEITRAIRRPGLPLTEIVSTAMEAYADRPALGERTRELVVDADSGRTSLRLLPAFETISYAELWARARAIADEWQHNDRHSLRAGEFVATLGSVSADYTAIDLACVRSGAVAVPLQSTAPVANLDAIADETRPVLLASSTELLDKAIGVALSCASLRRVIVFDYHAEVDDERDALDRARRRVADAGSDLVVEPLAEVIGRGRMLPPAPLSTVDPAEDRLAALIYTSGSTGTPKGAMYTDRIVISLWHVFFPRADDLPSISVNYLPMSHLVGRATLIATLASGGTAYFTAKSDSSTLLEDLSLVRPTELALVPRVCDVLFQQFQSELDRRSPGADELSSVADIAKAQLRDNILGGRVIWAVTTSAPLSASMTEFVESVLQQPLHDGYGSTEAGAVSVDHVLARPPVLEHQLADVPELGYFRTDVPYPRGELLLKSATLIPGYFKRPDATAEVFDENGFYHTGDVMAEVGPAELVYVDRRKNVLKLSQGEFVAVSRLEAIFVTGPAIRQIYVYGSSERAYLLAVVVPAPETFERAGGDPDRLKSLVNESLQGIAKEENLSSYEIPRDFLIETEPFTTDNGMLSGIRKLLRPRLKEHYGARLEQLYADLADRETVELRTLRATGRDQPVFDTVARAARAVLNSTADDPTPDTHFMDLGGDSLSALSLSTLLREIFGVEVPVGVIISPAGNLHTVAGYVEKQLAPGADRPTFRSIHGDGSTQAHADDLTLDKFIDAATLATATTLPPPDDPVRTVLLTGANGYLGRFLCLAWLERLAPVGGKLVCLVRGGTTKAARARLDSAFDTGDSELIRRYQELAEDHLEVLAGDIGEPGLGLDKPSWQRLAGTVDLIVHPAALVNHVLPYEQMFGPNVVGTAEVIRMAITTKIKPITFLSTIVVLASDVSDTNEESDIRVANPVRTLDDGYANGYAASKWAAEVLLREAHDLCGLPVATFRSDMILAHSQHTGQLNVPDMFTRLLLSLIVTGIAPGSFYRTAGRAHYAGLPADFIADAITTIGAATTKGYETYNVLNPHDDDISLDTYVDWLIDVGHPITRVDDYGEWFNRFEAMIRALPQQQKQHSLLPLLHAFTHPAEPVAGSDIPTARFRAAVREARLGPDDDIPHVTAALIHKYVDDLKHLGLV